MKPFSALIFLFLCCCQELLFAQDVRIDSLRNVIKESRNDTLRVNAWVEMSRISYSYNKDSSFVYAQTAYEEAEKTKFTKAKGLAANRLGLWYYDNEQYQQALRYFFEADSLYASIDFKRGLGNVKLNIGNVFSIQRDPENAIIYFTASLDYGKNIGEVGMIALAYCNLGNAYLDQKKMSLAIAAHSKSWNYYKKGYDVNGQARALSGLAYDYNELKDYKRSNQYGLIADSLKTFLGDKMGMAIARNVIGYNYLGLGNLENAEVYFSSALSLSKELNSLLLEKENYRALSELAFQKEDFRNAYLYYVEYDTRKDLLFDLDKSKQVNELNAKYQTTEKEKTILLQEEIIRRNRITLIGFGIASVLIVAFFSLFYSRYRIRRKLNEKLKKRNKQITKRNRIINAERKKTEELLLNILPAEIARELKENGHSEPRQFSSATVMFTDFKDFTVLAENMSPKELVEEVDKYFREFDRIIEELKLEKIKTIGDAYLVAGGLPVPSIDHAERMVIAAMKMVEVTARINKEKASKGHQPFQIRVGLHSGPLVAGIVGIRKFSYDIWGDTVNIAARMETSGEIGRINISGTTYEMVKDKFECSYRGKVPAKNKGEVDMYFIEYQKEPSHFPE